METPEFFEYAYQLEKDKQYDEAEDIYKSIIALKDFYKRAYIRLAKIYRKKKLYDQELQLLRLGAERWTDLIESRFQECLKQLPDDKSKAELKMCYTENRGYVNWNYYVTFFPFPPSEIFDRLEAVNRIISGVKTSKHNRIVQVPNLVVGKIKLAEGTTVKVEQSG